VRENSTPTELKNIRQFVKELSSRKRSKNFRKMLRRSIKRSKDFRGMLRISVKRKLVLEKIIKQHPKVTQMRSTIE
jgi:hypothetical protein